MWVVDMEKMLADAEPPAMVAKWRKHCIFRVPPWFKVVDGAICGSCNTDGRDTGVYKPQTVALGPFHHDDKDLKPMEKHKLRAVHHLLVRAGKTFSELTVAVQDVADELEDAYMDLEEEWRGKNRGKFLQMMIADGCFLLEVMKTAVSRHTIPPDYKEGDRDPVFSWHGIQHIKPFIQRDMLMVENQLPLRLLERIVAVTSPDIVSINSMVLKFLGGKGVPEGTDMGLHPLDIYRKSLLIGPQNYHHRGMEMMPAATDGRRPQRGSCFRNPLMKCRAEPPSVPRSALKLSEAGIHFQRSKTTCLDDIKFRSGRLEMPKIVLDDSTAYKFHNMMVFEAMHVGTRNDVTAYVLFLKDLVDSADDVRLLARKRILEHDLADNDEGVVRLFNGLTRDVYKNGESDLCGVHDAVEFHYGSNRVRVFLYESWANLKSKYFRSPWTLLALATAILLIVGDLVQAVYAVMSYDPNNKDNPKVH